MQLLVKLVRFPFHVSLLVPPELLDSSLLLIYSIRCFKHFLILHLAFVLIQFYLAIVSLLDILQLKLMHLCLLLLLILKRFFNTTSDLFTFDFSVFSGKLLLLEKAQFFCLL